jgi:centromere protein C
MPTSARKSSLPDNIGPVSRRGPHKPHVPYREGAEIGKKTGIAVEHVQRKSDGFEPFEDVIGQADKRSPPKVKNSKKKQRIVSPLYEDEDEDGEMSMEMDDSAFANSRSDTVL